MLLRPYPRIETDDGAENHRFHLIEKRGVGEPGPVVEALPHDAEQDEVDEEQRAQNPENPLYVHLKAGHKRDEK